ncbi:general secretion pathway protein GspB [Roseateles sp. BYS96W]|uniref:General secretion pathway protein GspB n=1 Tax=Pelomonas nitida TaxID=3299027 RepID=A0ABW7GB25_9BURK
MSYILEALRRAEADRERERGQVPGLHAQPLSVGGTASPAGGRRWLPWAGGGLLLLAGVGVGTWLAGGSHEPPPPLPAPAAAPVVAAPPPAEPVTAVVGTPPQTLPPPGGDAGRLPPVGAASPYLPPMPPPGTVMAPPAPRPAAPGASPARPPAPPAGAGATEAPLPRVSELPDGVRRELPTLAIGGSVYSDDPASRLVIVNGEVQHEGAKLTKDLVLEQIRPRELVLRFKGQRYRQPT